MPPCPASARTAPLRRRGGRRRRRRGAHRPDRRGRAGRGGRRPSRCSWSPTRAPSSATWPPGLRAPARDLTLVGITGTNGKTTTAYLVESALRALGRDDRPDRHGRDADRRRADQVGAHHAGGDRPARPARRDARARASPPASWRCRATRCALHRVDGVGLRRRAVHQPLPGPPRLPRRRWRTTSPPRRRCSRPSAPGAASSASTTRGARRLAPRARRCPVDHAVAPSATRGRRLAWSCRTRRRPGGTFALIGAAADRAALAVAAARRLQRRQHRAGRRRAARGWASPRPASSGRCSPTRRAGPDGGGRTGRRRRTAARAASSTTPTPPTRSSAALRGPAADDRRAGWSSSSAPAATATAASAPAMGGAAARGADVVVVTDDNPRSEDPAAIRAAVLAGARGRPADAQASPARRGRRPAAADRRGRACAVPRPGDASLVVGKGHETGQEIGGVVHPFDDREALRAALDGLGYRPGATADDPDDPAAMSPMLTGGSLHRTTTGPAPTSSSTVRSSPTPARPGPGRLYVARVGEHAGRP